MSRLLRMLVPIRRSLAFGAMLGAATVGSSVALLACSAFIISRAGQRPTMEAIAIPVVGVRLFGILRGVLRYLERLVVHDATFQVLADVRVGLLRAAAPHVPGLWVTEKRADWLARAVSDVEALQGFVARAAAPTLAAAVMAVAVPLWVGSLAPAGGWICLGGMLCAGWLIPAATRGFTRRPSRDALSARAGLAEAALDCVQGLPELTAMGRRRDALGRVDQATDAMAAAQWRTSLAQAAGAWAAQALAWGATGGILWLCAVEASAGRLPHVMVAVGALGALAGFETALGLPAAWQQTEVSRAAADRVEELADRRSPVVPEGGDAAPEPFLPIAVEDLTLRYAPDAPPALDGVSLTLRPGAMIALVGSSGSGKSTLAWALCGLLPVEGGRITAHGRPQSAVDGDAWRARIALVSQDAHLFDATVAANIALGSGAGPAEVHDAARAAQADGFVRSLPQGYETLVGERGSSLSGGQRRRIAVARALARRAELTILDEAGADLDPITEAEMLRSVRAHCADGALLVISHRPAAVADADEILVLADGRVAQRGRHADLLAAPGPYRRLWEAQALAG
ncbi:MAG: thiol reductant ABC exporter subunit CydC [Armatimonadetes bacterium]|nr:thiol reductant ABC exporter subunit CydC [Armatimonadota bacterium]